MGITFTINIQTIRINHQYTPIINRCINNILIPQWKEEEEGVMDVIITTTTIKHIQIHQNIIKIIHLPRRNNVLLRGDNHKIIRVVVVVIIIMIMVVIIIMVVMVIIMVIVMVMVVMERMNGEMIIMVEKRIGKEEIMNTLVVMQVKRAMMGMVLMVMVMVVMVMVDGMVQRIRSKN